MGFMGLYTLVMALEEEKEENNTSTHSEKKSKTQGEGKVEGERADQKNDDFPGIYSGEDGSISYTETRRPVEMLSLKDMPEMKWGNTPTR